MDINNLGQLVTNLGFPIALVLLLLWFFYKKVWGLIVEQMNRITKVNEELVKTNRELCSSMNIKLGIIEDKVDKIANELDT
ncbi:Uncharacterised protein [Clostridium paraputrificum]|uniref:hypothetical protein n=1 Tax=Clostridium paraputrificum TaxID=29363 RepID=UPI000D8379B3|nr:hypothetical protein [Clostridium paraputrificum]SQB99788.1 Uncharacterised protein [Clostridium paraputrificum]